jgi:hypothetical protein
MTVNGRINGNVKSCDINASTHHARTATSKPKITNMAKMRNFEYIYINIYIYISKTLKGINVGHSDSNILTTMKYTGVLISP